MSDIVDQLRLAVRDERQTSGQLHADAADEIDRLRDRVEELEGLLRDSHMCISVAQEAITERAGIPWKGDSVTGLLNEIAITLARQPALTEKTDG